MNLVDFLLTNKDITYEIRTEIKRLGRPIPDLIISKTYCNVLFISVMGGNQSAWTHEGCVGKRRHKATA
ncbi:hypothetical protein NQ318_013232 [Aromia moschata]|uniref:Uncharacterized protein n=1 Tax=Aromia moschata TaxID=1265417 RepID=A0AAV8Y9I8_9CUCU|nr:hypothetical protein NQ318_013232 [Aromia moschata]